MERVVLPSEKPAGSIFGVLTDFLVESGSEKKSRALLLKRALAGHLMGEPARVCNCRTDQDPF